MKGKSLISKTRQGKDSTMSRLTSGAVQLELPLFAIVESLPQSNETTSTDKSPICSLSTQKLKSSETLGQDSTSNGKDCAPYWTDLAREISDRLARFGFELIQYLVEQNGGDIVVLDQNVYCPNSELTADLLSILHVFSCRMHGLRKYSQKIKQDPDLSESRTEENS
jgi:hypothetical protein